LPYVAALGALGLVARRFGLSAIPAYLLAGLLLGPNEPTEPVSGAQPEDFIQRVDTLVAVGKRASSPSSGGY